MDELASQLVAACEEGRSRLFHIPPIPQGSSQSPTSASHGFESERFQRTYQRVKLISIELRTPRLRDHFDDVCLDVRWALLLVDQRFERPSSTGETLRQTRSPRTTLSRGRTPVVLARPRRGHRRPLPSRSAIDAPQVFRRSPLPPCSRTWAAGHIRRPSHRPRPIEAAARPSSPGTSEARTP
jgi:hypothetical protein